MIRNFLFHRINPKREKLWDPMDVKHFESCVKYISKNFKVAPFEELVKEHQLSSKTKCAAIMFDDGYKDNIEYAADILDKYKCKASFYVVTDCVEKNIPIWTHVLEYLFEHTAISNIDLSFDFLPAELRIKKLLSKNDRVNYLLKLRPALKNLSHTDRCLVLSKVNATYTDVLIPSMMMGWGDLKELKNAGHLIGSHTVTHPMLATMTDEKEIRNELVNSAKIIEEKLGHFPTTIAYPLGNYNETIKKISKEVGYKTGLTVLKNHYNKNKEDLFEIDRIELFNESWFKTRLRINNTIIGLKTIIKKNISCC